MKIANGYLITVEDFSCAVRRVAKERYYELAQHVLAVEVDSHFWWDMEEVCQAQPIIAFPNLAEFYAMFRAAFGESDSFFDDWKGAFSFVFTVDIFQERATIPYVLNVMNFRGSVEFRYKKVLSPAETTYDRMLLYPPFPEFSQTQMGMVSAYLWIYAQGFWETCGAAHRPFLKQVDSNLILFGYADGEFFERRFDSQEEFEAARLQWLRQHESAVCSRPEGTV
jgi:hypothetical protein